MSEFDLKIITPLGEVLNQKADSVIAPGEEGSFGVLANHAPIVAALGEGTLRVKSVGTDKIFQISKGVLEVNNNQVLVLTDKAIAV